MFEEDGGAGEVKGAVGTAEEGDEEKSDENGRSEEDFSDQVARGDDKGSEMRTGKPGALI